MFGWSAEDRERYKEWLAGLKPGDEVAIPSRDFGKPSYRVQKVTKVTPTGRVKTDDGEEYNNSGQVRGKGYYRIEPVTDEVRNRVHRVNMEYKASRLMYDAERNITKLTLEQLESIIKILGIAE